MFDVLLLLTITYIGDIHSYKMSDIKKYIHKLHKNNVFSHCKCDPKL